MNIQQTAKSLFLLFTCGAEKNCLWSEAMSTKQLHILTSLSQSLTLREKERIFHRLNTFGHLARSKRTKTINSNAHTYWWHSRDLRPDSFSKQCLHWPSDIFSKLGFSRPIPSTIVNERIIWFVMLLFFFPLVALKWKKGSSALTRFYPFKFCDINFKWQTPKFTYNVSTTCGKNAMNHGQNWSLANFIPIIPGEQNWYLKQLKRK